MRLEFDRKSDGKEFANLHTGKEAPPACPACAHPQAPYELLGENY